MAFPRIGDRDFSGGKPRDMETAKGHLGTFIALFHGCRVDYHSMSDRPLSRKHRLWKPETDSPALETAILTIFHRIM